MNYLITGGAGFIGRHLVDRLLKDGSTVTVIDKFSNGKLKKLPIHNPRLKIYKRSILDNLKDSFVGIDVVYHLAATAEPLLSIQQPQKHHLINVDGTLNVLINCRDNHVKKIVFASSSLVYGDQKKYPLKETALPNPMFPYSLQKLMGEQYCQLFAKIYGLESNCLRLFNVYGNGMNPKSTLAIPRFINLIKGNKRPTIHGTGEQIRDYIYVDDVVEAMFLAGKSKISGEVFNIGYGKGHSVNDIFELICKKLDKKVKPVYEPRFAFTGPKKISADSSKAYRLLGWKPKINLDEGLERTIKELKNE